jgi:hypothetical protein
VLDSRGLGQLGVQMSQIGVRLDAIGAARTDDGVQICAGLCSQLRIAEKPSAATESKGPDSVLNPVVVGRCLFRPK